MTRRGARGAPTAHLVERLLLHVAPGRLLLRPGVDEALFALAGERWAERRLLRQGWTHLARRLRSRFGELDLVLRDGATLVVCEVKTGRAGPRFRPAQRVTVRALAARWRAAEALAEGGPHRVDLLEVRIEGSRRLELVHLRGLRRPP